MVLKDDYTWSSGQAKRISGKKKTFHGDQIALRESLWVFTTFYGVNEIWFKKEDVCRKSFVNGELPSCDHGCALIHRHGFNKVKFCGEDGAFISPKKSL